MIYIIIGAVLLLLFAAFYVGTFFLFRYVFYSRTKKAPNMGTVPLTEGYELIKEKQSARIAEFKAMSYEPVEIKSFDGLTLCGRFFPCEGSKNAVIIFHGFRSHVNHDGALLTRFCLERGFNVLAVHQRAHDKSEGTVITFGIKERYDCKSWVDYTVQRLGDDARIMLTGVSMGASTVMMASELDIPAVKGIFADCGFSSPRDILCAVMGRLGYPTAPTYGLLRLSALIHGHFDTEKASATSALEKSNIPITIIHSEADGYVPCYMANKCYDAAKAEKKRLIIVKDARHGLNYYYETELYETAAEEMLKIVANSK